jgi:cation diffusion facilitator family transporter
MHDHSHDYDIGRHGAKVGVGVNTTLFIGKLVVGVLGRSHAMVADALHTATDAFTSIGVYIGFKIAQKPPDAEHPYGHGRAESIAAKLVSFVLILGGLKVAFDSAMYIIHKDLCIPRAYTLIAAILSIVVKEWMFRYTYGIGRKIQSNSLMSDAWHHRSDALSSVAALIGIGGARLGFPILDPLAGIAVSIFVIKAGLRLFHTAYDELMDAALPDETMELIKKYSVEIEGVKRVQDVKGRKMGIEIMIDMTIEVDRNMSVEDAHSITSKIKQNILKNVRGAKNVLIHVEPFLGK